MIAIEQITEQELEKRFNSLPPILQEALDSAQNLQVVRHICESHHLLDEEKRLVVEQAAALVFLGYLRPEEVSLTLEESLGLNHRSAASVAEALNSRVFSGLRNEIDKVYAPLQAEARKLEASKKPAVVPAVITDKPAPPGVLPMFGKETKPTQKPFIDLTSLSRAPASLGPMSKLSVSPVSSAGKEKKPPAPAPVGPTKPSLPDLPAEALVKVNLPVQAKKKFYSELTAPPKPAAPPAPSPTTPPAPAPIFLKKKPELEPLKLKTSIRLESISKFGDVKAAAPPPKPARLQIGKPPAPPPKPARPKIGKPPLPPPDKTPKPIRTRVAPPRVVSYSQWQTQVAKVQPPKPPAPPEPAKPGSETSDGAPRKEDKPEVLLPGKPPVPPSPSSKLSAPPPPPRPLAK